MCMLCKNIKKENLKKVSEKQKNKIYEKELNEILKYMPVVDIEDLTKEEFDEWEY